VNTTDELLARVDPAQRVPGGQAVPGLGVAIVTCMDARIDPARLFGVGSGDAHVLRNAGGLVTDDVVRSLAVSQHKLGTRAVLVIQHADCGMEKATEEELVAELTAHAGTPPPWKVGAFSGVDASVRRSLAVLRESPFLVARDDVRGFVFVEATGELREVS
jgi:carbonic anhydrase